MTEKEAYVAFNLMEGVGPVTARTLIDRFGSASAALGATDAELLECRGGGAKLKAVLEQRTAVDPAAEIARAGDLGARVMTPCDDDYPDLLSQIHPLIAIGHPMIAENKHSHLRVLSLGGGQDLLNPLLVDPQLGRHFR